jgi:hypothetical protein
MAESPLMKPENIADILKRNISFSKFLEEQLDLDKAPEELEQIDEGFDCLPTMKEVKKRQEEYKDNIDKKNIMKVDTSSITSVKQHSM